MIDNVLYRCRIGLFWHSHSPKNSKSQVMYHEFGVNNNKLDKHKFSNGGFTIKGGLHLNSEGFIEYADRISFCSSDEKYVNLGLIYYYLFMLCFIMFGLCIISCATGGYTYQYASYLAQPFHGLPLLSTIHVKLLYCCLISYLFLHIKICSMQFCKKHNLEYLTPANIFFGKTTSRFRQGISTIFLYIMSINLILITIINPSMLNPGPQNLSVYYQNVQGLIPFSQLGSVHPLLDRSKIFELNNEIFDKKPDLVMLNETWLNKSIKSNEVIENSIYNVFRSDRSQLTHPSDPNNPTKFRKRGGGVLIAVRSDIEATCKRISLKGGAEIVAIEITLNGTKFIFCTCYRVGTLGIANHHSIRSSVASFYKSKRPKRIFIVGDFNLSSVNWPLDDGASDINRTENLFVDTFINFGLSQCIESPTHIKGKTLDILLTNYRSLINNVKVLEHNSICKSDHFPITFQVKVKVNKRKKPIRREILNFKRADWDALNNDLCSTDWNAILDRTEPELAWSKFKSKLFYHVNNHIPTIKTKSEFQAPWFDSDAKRACDAKEKARKKFKRTKSMLDELNFRNARREFKNTLCQKMRDNMYNTDDPALITKKFWSHQKFTTNTHRLPECMYLKNCYRNNPADQAGLFNNFFYDQFSESSNYNISIDYTNDENFEISFCHIKIRKLLSKINSNKACGPDAIHGRILKNCAVSLAYPLSLLFKLSYNTGSVPREWKLAHVVPIHKKGSKENIENYRPISLTSLVMKTFERILKEEILVHTSHLLDTRQHGFLSNKSCSTNMVGFCDSLALSLNDCNRTDVVYFDFSKAFDSVNHDLLLRKLKLKYNIDGRLLKFIVNYLSEREQCVVIGNSKSSTVPVLSGVPQGSILGPILFVLFINDLPEGLSPDTNLALYADDTKIWRTIHTELDHEILQNDIAYLNSWATLNKMKFHPQKCKVVSIAHHPPPLMGILPDIQYFYALGESPLDYADSEKDLGVDINTKLNFNDQCNRLFSKANQQFGLTKRTCYFVKDIRRRRALYLSLIRSQFEHCSPIWRPCGKTMINKLESLQKSCIKWILSEDYINYNSYDIYIQKCRQVNLLPLVKRFELNDLILFHKIFINLFQSTCQTIYHYSMVILDFGRVTSIALALLIILHQPDLVQYTSKNHFFIVHILNGMHCLYRSVKFHALIPLKRKLFNTFGNMS